MKTINGNSKRFSGSMRTFMWSTSTALLAIMFLSLTAKAVEVSTQNVRLDGNKADFGTGIHATGIPTDTGVVTYDYATVDGLLVATGRVQGELFWDSAFGGGCARVTIRFRDSANDDLDTRQIDLCGPGGDANNFANRKTVDESFASSSLNNITITTAEVQLGRLIGGASSTRFAPTTRSYKVRIVSGRGDFGTGFHINGSPAEKGLLTFNRFDQLLEATVTGTLYWDDLLNAGCARALIDFRRQSGTLISRRTRDECGPGGNANDSSNQKQINESFSRGSLWRVRLQVGAVENDNFVNSTTEAIDFNGPTGNFELSPAEHSIAVRDTANYAFTWTVPRPLNWHDLRTLDLRITDAESATVIWLRFDEASNTFSLFNERTGRFGPAFAPGSQNRLQTSKATLHLAEAGVSAVNSPLGSGPNSPSVTLNLPLTFKPSAAGNMIVEAAASDDFGNEDPFAVAGALTVVR